eukprot:2463065-Prorocentrum_lima.AAC.1
MERQTTVSHPNITSAAAARTVLGEARVTPLIIQRKIVDFSGSRRLYSNNSTRVRLLHGAR